MKAFSHADWSVAVLTQFPNYPAGNIAPGYKGLFKRETNQDGSLYRVRPIFPGRKSILWRTAGEVWFNVVASPVGLCIRSITVVYVTSPSVFSLFSGYMLAGLKGVPLVIEIRDLTWRYAQELGKVKGRAVSSLLEKALLGVARRADRVVVTNGEQLDYFLSAGISKDRLLTVPNGIDPDLITSSSARRVIVGGRIRVLYGGLIGYPQGLRVLLDVAEYYRGDSEVEFVLMGEGPEKASLLEEAGRRKLTNVEFWDGVPREMYLERCSEATILFAHLKRRDSLRTALPSKLFEYMAVARPIIFAGEGAGADLIQQSGSGVVVPPEKPFAIRAAIETLRRNAGLREQMGENGREFVVTRYDRAILLDELVKDIGSLIGRPGVLC